MRQLRLLSFAMLFLMSLSFLPKAAAQAEFSLTNLSDPSDYLTFKKKKKKSDYSFKEHLWFGGGIDLGFNSGFGYSLFGFGVSPMVGYKIFGPVSAGPRLSVNFTSVKFQGIGTYNLFDVELGLFARVRIIKGLFIQGELATVWDQDVNDSGVGKYTQNRPAQYVGLGYNFSNGEGGVGQEISIMYDFYVGNDVNSYQNPWIYRFGITFGF